MKLSDLIILLSFCIFSCDSREKQYSDLLEEWIDREINIPSNMVFTVLVDDTVNFGIDGNYKILTYVDSIGCVSCKLQLNRWKELMADTKMDDVKYLFFFASEKKRDFMGILKAYGFTYPVCIDESGNLNSLNHFPSDERFQTFLLDKDNRVLAVGNPIHNPKIKELYLKIIRGETVQKETGTSEPLTSIQADRTSADLGSFARSEEQKVVFNLKNTGRHLLVVHDVTTSCGCITVDYSKEPVRPGDVLPLTVTYRADEAGYFSKTATVYCNAEGTPLVLNVKGTAEEKKTTNNKICASTVKANP